MKELERAYAAGDNIGDGHIKVEIAEAINELLEPMRERRAAYEGRDDVVMDVLLDGCRRANERAEDTLALAKEAASLHFFGRDLQLKAQEIGVRS